MRSTTKYIIDFFFQSKYHSVEFKSIWLRKDFSYCIGTKVT